MATIRAPFSSGIDINHVRPGSPDRDTNVKVNSLNVNTNVSAVTAVLAGTTITAAMVNDNDLFFVSQGAGATDRIFLGDDLPVGTYIHFFAEDIFLLGTETYADVINNVASKLWTLPAADEILHCLKTHTDNWQVTCETAPGVDRQVIPATA